MNLKLLKKRIVAATIAGVLVTIGSPQVAYATEFRKVDQLENTEVLVLESTEALVQEILESYEDSLTDIITVEVTTLNVRTGPSTDYKRVDQVHRGDTLTVVEQTENGWYEVEYGEETRFVCGRYVSIKSYTEEEIEEIERVKKEAQTAGEEVVEYAMQFVGNPYVWGGTSLTNGADCSGFVQAIYKKFGINLPRTSSQQRSAGVSVPYSEVQLGDIICYDGHVGIYMGDGKIVNAINSRKGIGTLSATYTKILSVRRVL